MKTKLKRIIILGVFMAGILPSSAQAIPAFARKYDVSCTSCHTKPPRLNVFGEAFHMAGFQIPMVEEGETKKKRRIGRIWSETDFLNIFSVRATGNFVESFYKGDPSETNLTLPQEVEIYLAGTLAQNISYFFELENETKAVEGIGGDSFEAKSRFGLGKEFFLMFHLDHFMKGLAMGPMVMIGKIDPSTNFSYPTNRQLVLNVLGRIDLGKMTRFTLAPYAFSSKFFGVKTGEGDSIEITREVLYNTTGDFGIDVHGMVGRFMFQTGVMQGLSTGTTDANQKKDPYLMTRMNFGEEKYISGSLSGLLYWGNDTAMVDQELIDWFRYGFSGNLKYRLLDLYGAVIWDKISDLPDAISNPFDDTAFGLTIEGDYLVSDQVLFSTRYDQLNGGGFINEKANGKVFTVQARYYVRDDFSLYLRDSYNLEGISNHPLQNFRNLIAFGVDFSF